MTDERWFLIKAASEQNMYGFGTPAECDEYLAILNRGREFHLYWAMPVTDADAKALALEDGMSDAYNLGEALDAAWDVEQEA